MYKSSLYSFKAEVFPCLYNLKFYILFQEVRLSSCLKMVKDGLRRNEGLVPLGIEVYKKFQLKNWSESVWNVTVLLLYFFILNRGFHVLNSI